MSPAGHDLDEVVEHAFRQSWGRVIAAAFRVTGDLDTAQEAAADSFTAAVEQWSREGVPRSTEAWLVTAARRRAIDQVRRAVVARQHRSQQRTETAAPPTDPELDELRFLALLAGADLTEDAQLLLLLRFGCGLSTEALAAMHYVPRPTMAARLTRAKQRLQATFDPADPLAGDVDTDVHPALEVISRAVYLIFTAGTNPATGESATDQDRLWHADFLSAVLHRRWPNADTAALRIMVLLATDPPDVAAAHRLARAVEEGSGPLPIQARIMLAHTADRPDWLRIAELYDALLRSEPNATFAVGRAVACSYAFGPDVGLADLDDLATRPELAGYRYLHAARAECLARLGRTAEAATAYARAAELASNAAQRAYFAGHADR